MLETMKRNKILTYAFLMAFPMTVGSIFSSCTDDFEKLNTSNIQVNPADLPFAAQCTEPMTYCYPPQQNMFQFWTNLTIDLYGGYFMTPNGNFTNGDMGENRGHSGGMYRTGLRNIDDYRCLRTDTLQFHPVGRKRSVFRVRQPERPI